MLYYLIQKLFFRTDEQLLYFYVANFMYFYYNYSYENTD